MDLSTYYSQVLVPANCAVSEIRRAGMVIDLHRLEQLDAAWAQELARLQGQVEGEAARRGMPLKYSAADAIAPATLAKFLYSPQGLGLEVHGKTTTGQASTDDAALQHYASLTVPRPDDHPIVYAILKIRSLQGGRAKWLAPFRRAVRSDGAIHAKYNWALRTSRLSSENPQVQNIPERADKEIADGVKSCIIPRVMPVVLPPEARTFAEVCAVWDPRKHGSCARWDITGAEANIRAAMLPALFCSRPDPVAYEYLRLGKDIHSKTASLIYNVPEGTYKKGSYERDAVGKQTFFAKIFGASYKAVQQTMWKRARVAVSDDEAKQISTRFDQGYPGLVELYEFNKDQLGRLGYCEDGYGRRRKVGLPPGVRYLGLVGGKAKFEVRERETWRLLEHAFHISANTDTQSMNATDCLFMLALLHQGERMELSVPPMWEARGVLFPEAKAWRMNGGPGPGGKPMRSWHSNTVHDSGWLDCAPGYLEPTAMLLFRRCTAVPFDWRLKADVPYRIDFSVGPNMGLLFPYNEVAHKFGLTPMPKD